MNARNFSLTLLLLVLAGCATPTNDASKWTIELASTDPSPTGSCRIYDEAHRLMLEGNLASGRMDGTWTSTGSDGVRLATWTYREGVRHGPVRMWFGSVRNPEAGGRLKLEGAFANGAYDGMVVRNYATGAKQSERVYERGMLKSSRYWSSSGVEAPATDAAKESEREHEQDMDYLSTLEDMVKRSLTQARREIAR